MAVYTKERVREFNYPHIAVYRKSCDGDQYAWEFETDDGFVMYDTNEHTTIVDRDPVSGSLIEVPHIFYSIVVSVPLHYNWDNFSWLAVPRDSVPEEDIF